MYNIYSPYLPDFTQVEAVANQTASFSFFFSKSLEADFMLEEVLGGRSLLTMRGVPPGWLSALLLLAFSHSVAPMVLHNITLLEEMLEKSSALDREAEMARSRGRRAITESDMWLILDLHNKLRGQVYPQASNMEHMVRGKEEVPFH